MDITYKKHFKGILELLAAVVILIVSAWLMLLIMAVYLLFFEGPIFFRQVRIGHHGKPFVIYKFRTLQTIKAPLEQRAFWWGSLLRQTSLDELPQLFNVIRGDMALIGPRPLPIFYKLLFSAEQLRRFDVKPGITGWVQVNGRHSIPWEKKIALDIYYIKHLSLGLDMLIVGKTVLLLLSFKKDASLQEKAFVGV